MDLGDRHHCTGRMDDAGPRRRGDARHRPGAGDRRAACGGVIHEARIGVAFPGTAEKVDPVGWVGSTNPSTPQLDSQVPGFPKPHQPTGCHLPNFTVLVSMSPTTRVSSTPPMPLPTTLPATPDPH